MFEENEISIKANGGTELAKRDLAARLPQDLLSNFQIICSRVRELDESKIRIYWCHDLPDDPECSKLADINFRNKFHKIVYVSNWQYNQFRTKLNLPYSHNDIIIENGIEPFVDPFANKQSDKLNLVYTSTPQRGLNILVPVFELLQQHFSNIHLHVFSSFEIYGWKEMDDKFEDIFQRCRNNSGITYHGYKPYDAVREQLSKSHIFAYPSIWEETSCRALIEAMSAGLICVHPNYGALSDTAGGTTYMYQGDYDLQQHATIFANTLYNVIAMINNNKYDNYLQFTKNYADVRFNITKIVKQWEVQLNELGEVYKDPETRKFPKQILTFKTGG